MSNIHQNVASTTSSAPAQVGSHLVPDSISAAALDEASLIYLQPRTPATIHSEEEARRCWVCYSTDQEDAASGDVAALGEWRSPCRCSLVAHERCLLNWIASEFSKEGTNRGKIECPQCKTRIRFKQKKSLSLDVITTAMKVANATVPANGLLSGVGSVIIVGCTVYGVNAVYMICGSKFANQILLGPNTTDFQWTWRLGVGLPLIPFILVGSRTRSLDATMPVLPFIFFCHQDPLHFSIPPSPAVTLALLPYLRGAYYSVWDRYLKPYEDEWSKAVEPALAENEEGNADGAAAGEPEEGVEGVAAAAGDRQRRQNQQQQGWQGEVVVENHNIMIHGSNVTNTIVGALLLPSVSALVGSLLGRIPALRRALPESFHRNILGGCLFVVLKDVISLYYKFKRAQQHRSRMILDYQKSKGKITK